MRRLENIFLADWRRVPRAAFRGLARVGGRVREVEEVEEVSAVEEGRGGGTVPLNPNTDIILSLLFCPSTRTHTAWAQSGQRTSVL